MNTEERMKLKDVVDYLATIEEDTARNAYLVTTIPTDESRGDLVITTEVDELSAIIELRFSGFKEEAYIGAWLDEEGNIFIGLEH